MIVSASNRGARVSSTTRGGFASDRPMAGGYVRVARRRRVATSTPATSIRRTAATTAKACVVVSDGRLLAVRWLASTLAGGHCSATTGASDVDGDGGGAAVVVGAAGVEGTGVAAGRA